jgi:hypothetical protein
MSARTDPLPPPRRFYRIVRTDPPSLLDFTSNLAIGRPLPKSATRDVARLWSGLCYHTAAQARRQARGVPILADFIAELTIEARLAVRFERTLGAEHYTVWGDPALLPSCVTRLTPVRRETTETDQ